MSESWHCVLFRVQIDGSWYHHQRLWALLMVPIHPSTKSLLDCASGRLLPCAVKHSVQNGGVVWKGLRVAPIWGSDPRKFLRIYWEYHPIERVTSQRTIRPSLFDIFLCLNDMNFAIGCECLAGISQSVSTTVSHQSGTKPNLVATKYLSSHQ